MKASVLLISVLGIALTTTVLAQSPEAENLQPIEDGAPILTDIDEAELAPEVTIRRDGGTQYREYRLSGKLYKVEVIPEVGPPYYLMDMRGNGEWTRLDSANSHLIVPQWVILRF